METIASLVDEFLSQPAIAVVGISSSKQTVANGVYKKLKAQKRTVFAVGKNTSSFGDDRCYPDLASLPAPVHGVFIAVKKENTGQIIDECIKLGIPRVWMHNFSGTSFSSGSSATPDIVQKCRDHNISVIPGACPMMFVDNADVGHKCIRWFLNVTGKLK
jgi:predicted CoA-binding protein